MIDNTTLITLFERNYREISTQIDGLTHADSLLQLPFRANCLNWILGHIVGARVTMLKALRAEPHWTDEQRTRYRHGTQPITPTNADEAYPFDDLRAALDESQRRLIAALEHATLETLAARAFENDPNDTRSVGDLVAYLLWHEAYHTGQTEFLRQLSGKNDAVF